MLAMSDLQQRLERLWAAVRDPARYAPANVPTRLLDLVPHPALLIDQEATVLWSNSAAAGLHAGPIGAAFQIDRPIAAPLSAAAGASSPVP
jgi:hypothetical protein